MHKSCGSSIDLNHKIQVDLSVFLSWNDWVVCQVKMLIISVYKLYNFVDLCLIRRYSTYNVRKASH